MAEHFIAEGLHYHVAGRAVIDNVSLALTKGELVALIGPNGAGKSTLLRLLTGFLKPATGRCVLAGKPLEEWFHPNAVATPGGNASANATGI